jgi:hypothetical protein
MSSYNLQYFNYSIDEDLHKVYNNLDKKIKNNNYDILIGHSLGGGLLLKYFTNNKESINKYKKIIYLMPLIHQQLIRKFLFDTFSWVKYLPKYFICPNDSLFDNGNILNDTFVIIPIHQLATQYKDISSLDISLINNSNSHMLYVKNELLTPIDSVTLNKITNKTIINGKHECFNETSNCTEFFSLLKNILLS